MSMSFNVGSGDMSFEKEDGTWYYAPDRDFPLIQSYPEDMAGALGELTADRHLEDGDSLADYGLDDPDYTVEFTDGSGATTSIYFGNVTGDYYYVTVDDAGEVYTVSTAVIDDLNYSLDDMAQLDEYPSIGSGNLARETITQNGETTTYDSENEEQTLTLYIGNENGEGDRYVMINDSRIVYLISDTICDNILNVSDEES